MEIEIPKYLYEMLLIEAARTDSTIEKVVELCFKKFMERSKNNANQ